MNLSSWRTTTVVLISGALVLWLVMGIRQTFGLFLQPMSAELGWGRETFAMAMAVQNLLWGLAQPAAGIAADKYGSGRVVAVGGLVYAFGLYLMSQTTSGPDLMFSAGFLMGLALSATTFSVVLAAVARAVPENRRSMALGLVSAGGSFGQFAMIPAGQAFLATYGWSTSFALLGLCALLVMPLAAALAGKGSGTALALEQQSMRGALLEARGHGGYRYLTTGFFVCGFQVVFIAVHLPAFLTDKGFSPALAATALSLIGFFNVIGSLACGYLGGRYSKKAVLSLLYLGRSAITLWFVLTPMSNFSVLLFASVMGLLWLGTVPLTIGLVGQIFGPRYMGTLFGIVFLSHQIGSFLGVWLGGYLFDVTGSYQVVWWLIIILGVAAALLHWPIDERRVPRLAAAE